ELVPENTDPAWLEAARQNVIAYFRAHGEKLAAFVAEPLIQGAGGMRFWAPELLQEIRTQCDRHGVYLILDEVMTGFGRTGTFLALEQARIQPDFLCLSKGLTGGLLPLALTWTTEAVYAQFWGDMDRTFFHGHTYTANATACAVAVASLALFDDEPVLERAQTLSDALRRAWGPLAAHPAVRRARTLGTVAACQMVDPATGQPHSPERRFGWSLHRRALEKGLLVRPMGSCLYLLPPLAATAAQIEEAVATVLELLD
ncbi:MAG: aminotransferase class III-fold pyridoxal phosphate-dependent enzyme, partial [Firmicutes bacterium]|nr:aminotransferase class III-fold pyridoxal phosphate-dependent enzyme [Bacillota bacterium]